MDVLKNVSSVSNLIMMILTFLCSKYNNYMANLDFIEEIIRYKNNEKYEKSILKMILNTEEEPVPVENESKPPKILKKNSSNTI